jgi:glycerol-3-phosphate O-acyltransferase
MIRNKWERFGFACVNFGHHISVGRYCLENDINFSSMDRETRFPEVEKLSYRLLDSIKAIIPVLPVPLVAFVLIENRNKWMTEFDLKAQIYNLMEDLKANGATVNVPDKSREDTINSAINMLKIRKMIIRYDGHLKADPDMFDILSYYANSIVQWRQNQEWQDQELQNHDMKITVDLQKKNAGEIKDVSRLKKETVPAPS